MTGRLLVSTPDTPIPPHTHAILTLSSGKELRFVDPRRFGRLSVVAPNTKYTGPGAEPGAQHKRDRQAESRADPAPHHGAERQGAEEGELIDAKRPRPDPALTRRCY